MLVLFLLLLGAQLAGPQSAPSGYVGSEACKVCHEDIANDFSKSPHFVLNSRKQWKDQSCESCHGPGAQHADAEFATTH